MDIKERITQAITLFFEKGTEPAKHDELFVLEQVKDLLKKSQDKERTYLPMFYYEEFAKKINNEIPQLSFESIDVRNLHSICFHAHYRTQYKAGSSHIPEAVRKPEIKKTWWDIRTIGAFIKGKTDYYKLGSDIVGPGQNDFFGNK